MLDIASLSAGQTVTFGAGVRRNLKEHAINAGAQRVMILTTPDQSELGLELAETLGDRAAGIFSKATMHTPVHVTAEAMVHLEDAKADSVLSAGGGSTIGLGKALALRLPLVQIALPTTYAGSECTPILGQTENDVKTTLTDPRVRPDTVLYDAELVATLPVQMTTTSALNAMAHAVEALYAKDRDSDTDTLAVDGLKAFQNALPAVLQNPANLDARCETQKGAWACGTVLGRVGMALHHKLCHALGGSFDLPHAQTHAIVLPHAVAYNMEAAADALAPVADIFRGADPATALWEFAKDLGAPSALKDLGLAESDLDRAADIATQNPYWNPREITHDGIRALLQRGWEGVAPRP